MNEHHSSRRARALNRDCARQQSLRDRKKEAFAPTTHAIDRAIAHSFMVALKVERAKGIQVADATISAIDLLHGALDHLTTGTHGANSYDRDEVHHALLRRIQRDAPRLDGDD